MTNIYQENDYKDRKDYLESLADEYSIDYFIVSAMADMLGENEDFDGLVCELEDYSMLSDYETI